MTRVCLFVIVLAACGPGTTTTTECVQGAWLEVAKPACSGHSYCSTGSPPAECSLADCKVRILAYYEASGSYLKLPLLLSAQDKQFSKVGDGTTNAWSVAAGKLTLGNTTANFECSTSTLLIGDAPFRARSDRPDAELSAAIESARKSGLWASIKY